MSGGGWIGNYSAYRARINPDSEAVYDLDRNLKVTYRELDARADLLAAYLTGRVEKRLGKSGR